MAWENVCHCSLRKFLVEVSGVSVSRNYPSLAWWQMPIIPTPRKWKQRDFQFKACPGLHSKAFLKQEKKGVKELPQRLRAPSALLKDLGPLENLVLAPAWQLRTACDSSSRISDTLTQIYMQAKHQCIIKFIFLKKGKKKRKDHREEAQAICHLPVYPVGNQHTHCLLLHAGLQASAAGISLGSNWSFLHQRCCQLPASFSSAWQHP